MIRKVEAAIVADLETLKGNRKDEGTAVKHAEKQLRDELVKLQDAGAQGVLRNDQHGASIMSLPTNQHVPQTLRRCC